MTVFLIHCQNTNWRLGVKMSVAWRPGGPGVRKGNKGTAAVCGFEKEQ